MTTPPDDARDGPDPELGDAILALATAIERDPANARALRRLTRLLSPGISEFHEHHRALTAIFARIRDGETPSDQEILALLATAKAEAQFLITGAV